MNERLVRLAFDNSVQIALEDHTMTVSCRPGLRRSDFVRYNNGITICNSLK